MNQKTSGNRIAPKCPLRDTVGVPWGTMEATRERSQGSGWGAQASRHPSLENILPDLFLKIPNNTRRCHAPNMNKHMHARMHTHVCERGPIHVAMLTNTYPRRYRCPQARACRTHDHVTGLSGSSLRALATQVYFAAQILTRSNMCLISSSMSMGC